MEERVVSLIALVNAKKQSRLKAINNIIAIETRDEEDADNLKQKGLY